LIGIEAKETIDFILADGFRFDKTFKGEKMKLTLQKLVLRNFKGIKDFTLDTYNKDVKIFGDNATGKTTLMDAVSWLLFDKDSLNQKQFEIKTLKDGVAIPKLEHEVEAVFILDDSPIKLKKIYKEKYTKKRGQAVAEFTGHTTNYFIDDVPASKGDFTSKVVSLSCTEDVFRLLTSPTHFSQNLTWQKQRELLLEVCGGITDQDVIDSDDSLSGLPAILDGKTCDDRKAIIGATRKKINDEIKSIPARIDELSRNEVEHVNVTEINEKISELRKQVAGKDQEIFSIKNGDEIGKKRNEIASLDNQIEKIKSELGNTNNSAIYEKKKVLSGIKDRIAEFNREIQNKKNSIAGHENILKKGEAELERLRGEFKQIVGKEFTAESCPTCGKAMTATEEEAALKKFNLNKSNLIEANKSAGKEQAFKNKNYETVISAEKKEVAELGENIKFQEKGKRDIENEIKVLENAVTLLADNKEYQVALSKQCELTKDVKSLENGNTELIESIKEKRSELRAEATSYEEQISTAKQAEQNKKRIEELNAQEKALAHEYEILEGHLFLIEQFIKVKVSMLEERINNKFAFVSFRLFKDQINDGVREVCEVTVDGVPYWSLNNAARIQAGLDIINTMSNHYKFSPNIFIDNRESVTSIPEVGAQVISLIVSEQDKTLRVE